jgi:predicted protein tyrosine phosphatase
MNEKFQKLSEKLSKYPNKQGDINLETNKNSKLELKLENLEENFKSSIDTLECKHNALREHITKLKVIVEDEKNYKEEMKKNYIRELKELGVRINLQINEEREYMKNYTENLFNKLESSLIKLEKNTKIENEEIRKNLNYLKEHIDVDFPSLREKLEIEVEDRNKTIDTIVNEMNVEFNKINEVLEKDSVKQEENNYEFSDSIKKMTFKVKEELMTETNAREKFEENILKLLQETTYQLANL